MGAGIAIIICFSIFPLLLTGAFKRVPNQKKVKGIIHSNEFSHYDRDIDDGKNNNMYWFYVQYFVDGKEYLLKSKLTSMQKKIGKSITIKYNQNNPEEAVMCPEKKIYIFSLACFLFGIYVIFSSL